MDTYGIENEAAASANSPPPAPASTAPNASTPSVAYGWDVNPWVWVVEFEIIDQYAPEAPEVEL